MPHFDATISLGNILTAAGFFFSIWWGAVKMYALIDKRIAVFEEVLKTHTDTLAVHADRMEKQDDLLLRLVGDVQRLIGRIEVGASVRTAAPSQERY